MQYAGHCDAVLGYPEVYCVSSYPETPIPRSNVIASTSHLRLFRQRSKGSCNFIRVAVRLLEPSIS